MAYLIDSFLAILWRWARSKVAYIDGHVEPTSSHRDLCQDAGCEISLTLPDLLDSQVLRLPGEGAIVHLKISRKLPDSMHWQIASSFSYSTPMSLVTVADSSNLYVCGLSSGGAMAVNCLVAHPQKYAGGASLAGLAYGESPSAVKGSAFSIPRYHSVQRLCSLMNKNLEGVAPPNLLIIHSDGDHVVSGQATGNLEHSWKQVAGLESDTNEWQIDGEASDAAWTLHVYTSHAQQRLLRL